jgi:hypothetical protein
MLNRPFGVTPLVLGQAQTHRVTRYRVPSTDGSAYYIGDTLAQVAGADLNGVPNVQKNSGVASIRGFLVGIENPSINTPSIRGVTLDQTVVSIPASKQRDYYVLVADQPDIFCMAQDDGVTGANLVAASANLNASLTVAVPAQPYQLSASVLTSASFAVGAGLNFKLVGLAPMPAVAGGGSNTFGPFAIWVCRPNLHDFNGPTVGI